MYDFTDMLINYLKLNKVLPVKYALIDEAQDLTPLQWNIVDIAFRDCERIYIAGDDDQAIYDWCGGSADAFVNQTVDDGEYLQQSYRLNSHVLSEANKIVHRIRIREHKEVKPHVYTGNKQVHFHSSIESVPLDYSRSYYFLSRNKLYLQIFKHWLMKSGYPFKKGSVAFPRQITSARDKARLRFPEEHYIRLMKQQGLYL